MEPKGAIHLQCKRYGFDAWVRKIPGRKKWQLTPVFLPGKYHGWRSMEGYSPWGCKELDTTKQLSNSNLNIVHDTLLQLLCYFDCPNNFKCYFFFKMVSELKGESINSNPPYEMFQCLLYQEVISMLAFL